MISHLSCQEYSIKYIYSTSQMSKISLTLCTFSITSSMASLFLTFFVSIPSLIFSKTLIYLWNCSRTNFFAFSSDFGTSSLLSYSSATFFISIVSPFFCFLFLFCLFFCFCYSDFPCFSIHCFLYSFGHLIIFTSPVFQLILGL